MGLHTKRRVFFEFQKEVKEVKTPLYPNQAKISKPQVFSKNGIWHIPQQVFQMHKSLT